MRLVRVIIVLIISAMLAGLITSVAMAKAPGMATKPAHPSAVPTKVVRKIFENSAAAGDISRNIPRVSAIATPTPVIGVKGRGGAVVSPMARPRASPAVKHLKAGPVVKSMSSPTPVPGKYTPRFPGEPGYKATPTPTARPTVKKALLLQVVKSSTQGSCGCVPLTSSARYAARGPGIMDGSIVSPPGSAPGPNARPVAVAIVRRR